MNKRIKGFKLPNNLLETTESLSNEDKGKLFTNILLHSNGKEIIYKEPFILLILNTVKSFINTSLARSESQYKYYKKKGSTTYRQPNDKVTTTYRQGNDNLSTSYRQGNDELSTTYRQPNDKVTTKKRQPNDKASTPKFNKKNFREKLIELGCEKQHIEDWFSVRDKRRSPYTTTVLNKIVNECQRNDFSVAQAIRLCAENGWIGFDFSWVKNKYPNGYTEEEQAPKEDIITYETNAGGGYFKATRSDFEKMKEMNAAGGYVYKIIRIEKHGN